MVDKIRRNLLLQRKKQDEKLLHIYSAHDSTLIGLLCAFQLEQPIKWPEYASYLKIELLKDVDSQSQYYVRFTLNGEVLFCSVGAQNDSSTDLIPLDNLSELLLDSDDNILKT